MKGRIKRDEITNFITSIGGIGYYEMSAKSCYNFEKPFVFLMRELLDDPNIGLKVVEDDLIPPTIYPTIFPAVKL